MTDLILQILYVVLVLFVVALIILIVHMIKTVRKVNNKIEEISPVIEKLDQTMQDIQPAVQRLDPLLERVSLTVDAVNLEIMRADQILADLSDVTDTASGTVNKVAEIADAPLNLLSSASDAMRGAIGGRRERRKVKDMVRRAELAAADEQRRLDPASIPELVRKEDKAAGIGAHYKPADEHRSEPASDPQPSEPPYFAKTSSAAAEPAVEQQTATATAAAAAATAPAAAATAAATAAALDDTAGRAVSPKPPLEQGTAATDVQPATDPGRAVSPKPPLEHTTAPAADTPAAEPRAAAKPSEPQAFWPQPAETQAAEAPKERQAAEKPATERQQRRTQSFWPENLKSGNSAEDEMPAHALGSHEMDFEPDFEPDEGDSPVAGTAQAPAAEVARGTASASAGDQFLSFTIEPPEAFQPLDAAASAMPPYQDAPASVPAAQAAAASFATAASTARTTVAAVPDSTAGSAASINAPLEHGSSTATPNAATAQQPAACTAAPEPDSDVYYLYDFRPDTSAYAEPQPEAPAVSGASHWPDATPAQTSAGYIQAASSPGTDIWASAGAGAARPQQQAAQQAAPQAQAAQNISSYDANTLPLGALAATSDIGSSALTEALAAHVARAKADEE